MRRKWWWTSHQDAGHRHLNGKWFHYYSVLIELIIVKSITNTHYRSTVLNCYNHYTGDDSNGFYPQGLTGVSLPDLSLPHQKLARGSPGCSDGTLCPCRSVGDWERQKQKTLSFKPELCIVNLQGHVGSTSSRSKTSLKWIFFQRIKWQKCRTEIYGNFKLNVKLKKLLSHPTLFYKHITEQYIRAL